MPAEPAAEAIARTISAIMPPDEGAAARAA
jgi:hypothetical protein